MHHHEDSQSGHDLEVEHSHGKPERITQLNGGRTTVSTSDKMGINSQDLEKGEIDAMSPVTSSNNSDNQSPSNSKFASFYHRHKIGFDLAGWVVITG
ncbi:hypothetical protein LTR86_010521 [Recurvomyces mirabilis]|nr:hypothetical protein LTR86_010521 [Recurvomyces mirabilis]